MYVDYMEIRRETPQGETLISQQFAGTLASVTSTTEIDRNQPGAKFTTTSVVNNAREVGSARSGIGRTSTAPDTSLSKEYYPTPADRPPKYDIAEAEYYSNHNEELRIAWDRAASESATDGAGEAPPPVPQPQVPDDFVPPVPQPQIPEDYIPPQPKSQDLTPQVLEDGTVTTPK